MVASRCGVAVLRLVPLLALVVALLPSRSTLAEEDAVESLPAVKQEPLTTELAEGEAEVVPWEPGNALEVVEPDEEGKYTRWSAVRVEALLLWRDAPQSLPLVDFAAGGRALDARDLHAGGAAGPRFTLLSEDTDGEGSEIGYFDVASFQATREVPTVAGGYTTVTGLDGTGSTSVDGATAGLSSRIKSLEVISRARTSQRWVSTSGFRWVEWQESFSLLTGPERFGARAINSLYGHQIYGNVSKQDSLLASSGGLSSIATDTARVAFVGETGLTGTWQVREWLRARAGYQALWLGGIASATNQLQGQSLAAGSPQRGSTNTGGSVVLQGVSLGLEAHW
ncbi:MAG: hypothetical protein NT171_05840 [Planctomycetota bacterium]|nr:hypothetical protein [Planctomycetota bacterium]